MTDLTSIDHLLASARSLADRGAWAEVAQRLEPLATGAVARGDVVLLYGEALTRTGHEREACDLFRANLPSLEASGDRGTYMRAVNLSGVAAFALGALAEAEAAFNRARELAAESDELLTLARASHNLGTIANLRGEPEAALSHYRIALPTYQRLGQSRGLAETYHNIAIACRDLGELEEADESERRAIEYAGEGVVPRLAAIGRIGRAEIALLRGDGPLAETTARLAAEELARLGDAWHEADAHRVSGVAAGAQGKLDVALACFDRALAIARERGHSLNEADVLRDRVEVWVQRRDTATAAADARRAIELFRALGASAEVERLERRVASLA